MKTLVLELTLAATLAVTSGSSVLGQSMEADSPCGHCAREMKVNPASLEGALLLYVEALARGDRQLVSKYSARYVLDSKRRRIYRTVTEHTKLVDQMVGQAIRSFHLCSHMTSTAELSFPEAQREHTIIGCIKYVDGAYERGAHISVIAYRNRGRWIFSPLLVPEDPFRIKVPEAKPIVVPMGAPPPPIYFVDEEIASHHDAPEPSEALSSKIERQLLKAAEWLLSRGAGALERCRELGLRMDIFVAAG